ncbi:uncharacterized protein TRIVIDRAFT_62395 [Trichoderma virens Gv29-8]|uniref:Uncharacterized protein n=1 Tax=Hypocrea virens (strain Gv29-8 / FGSC 10586) TaxID=413071 RepID=G9MJR6_HYPVG|nr:uncharacterized protein TRIVIDRAFT_62395 [Trichoderma virens Gv29-8]EHK25728.1 hypothetical protein TRIVIDRAFT_62395 [Trichoderma virens Gv29-8]
METDETETACAKSESRKRPPLFLGMPGYSCPGSANQRACSGTGTHSHGLSRRDNTLTNAAAPLCLSPAIGHGAARQESGICRRRARKPEKTEKKKKNAERMCVIAIIRSCQQTDRQTRESEWEDENRQATDKSDKPTTRHRHREKPSSSRNGQPTSKMAGSKLNRVWLPPSSLYPCRVSVDSAVESPPLAGPEDTIRERGPANRPRKSLYDRFPLTHVRLHPDRRLHTAASRVSSRPAST